MIKKFVNILLVMFFICSNLFCYQTNTTPIHNKTYFQTTHKILQSAKSSIIMVMYVVSLHNTTDDSQVLQLVNDLIDAHKRGVKVKVILDRTIEYKKYGEHEERERSLTAFGMTKANEFGMTLDDKNEIVYEYLKNNGVEVYYDQKQTYTHAKCLVIDNKIVIMGSTNWSASAFTNNNEISAVIESKEYAKEVLEEINNIKVSQDTTAKDEDYLIFNSNMMKTFLRFIRKDDDTDYKLYFYILLYTTKTGEIRKPGNEQVEIDYKKCAQYLGFANIDDRFQRYYIRRALKRLEKNFNCLITYLNPNDYVNNPKIILQDLPFNVKNNEEENAELRLSNKMEKIPPLLRNKEEELRNKVETEKLLNKGGNTSEDREKIASLKACPTSLKSNGGNTSEEKCLYIPKKFFEYGWHKRLNIKEQYCYFINLIEGGREYNGWSKSGKQLSKEYGLSISYIYQSMMKLAYWNLLQIQRDAVEDGNYLNRFPNLYKLNELYSMEDFNKRLKKKLQDMINKYGKERIDRVKEYMRIACCEYDLDGMDEIILLEDKYGNDQVKKAFDTVSCFKSKDASKKNMQYIAGMLKHKE
jgi:hypothetical protein